MAESYHYALASTSSAILAFGGTNIRFVLIDVQSVGTSVAIFPAPPGNERLAHFGWIALGNDAESLTLMEPGIYMYRPIWVESMRQQHGYADGSTYATHLLWSLEPGCSVNAYVLTY